MSIVLRIFMYDISCPLTGFIILVLTTMFYRQEKLSFRVSFLKIILLMCVGVRVSKIHLPPDYSCLVFSFLLCFTFCFLHQLHFLNILFVFGSRKGKSILLILSLTVLPLGWCEYLTSGNDQSKVD